MVWRKVVITWRKVVKCWRKKFNASVSDSGPTAKPAKASVMSCCMLPGDAAGMSSIQISHLAWGRLPCPGRKRIRVHLVLAMLLWLARLADELCLHRELTVDGLRESHCSLMTLMRCSVCATS